MKQLTIDGVPVAKGRPRLGRYGTYTPKKTQEYEEYVKMCWVAKYGGIQPSEQPLEMNIVFYMPIPKSYSKKQSAEMLNGRIKHTKKPDIDNLIKSVLDALNGLAYADDSQIIKVTAVKRYAETGSTELTIKEGETP
jgi:Holliday junction resolvase RusA-like endonuclease